MIGRGERRASAREGVGGIESVEKAGKRTLVLSPAVFIGVLRAKATSRAASEAEDDRAKAQWQSLSSLHCTASGPMTSAFSSAVAGELAGERL